MTGTTVARRNYYPVFIEGLHPPRNCQGIGCEIFTLKTQAWELGITFNNGKDAIDRSNRVTYQGVDYTTKELDMSGVPRKTLMDRLRYGWTAEQAMTTPVRMGNWTHRDGRDREPTGTDITSIWLRKAWKL